MVCEVCVRMCLTVYRWSLYRFDVSVPYETATACRQLSMCCAVVLAQPVQPDALFPQKLLTLLLGSANCCAVSFALLHTQTLYSVVPGCCLWFWIVFEMWGSRVLSVCMAVCLPASYYCVRGPAGAPDC